MFFAYSTMISWSYYGDRCTQYLLGTKIVPVYRTIYVILVIVGAIGGLKLIWSIADVMNAMMAVPNLIALLALGGLVTNETRKYLKRLREGVFD